MLNLLYVCVFLVVCGKKFCSVVDWMAKNLSAMHGNSVKGAVVITDRFCTFSPSSISQLKVLEKQSLMSNSMPSASPCTPSTLKLFTKTSASTASSVVSNSIIPLPVLVLNTHLRKGRNSNAQCALWVVRWPCSQNGPVYATGPYHVAHVVDTGHNYAPVVDTGP